MSILSSQTEIEVLQFLGGGGQGEVYLAKFNSDSPEKHSEIATFSGKHPTRTANLALKWYFQHSATQEQKNIIEILVNKGGFCVRGSGSGASFLWPIELVASPDIPGFGYLMPLRENRFKSLFDLMKNRVDPSFFNLATAGLNLAHGFLQLHSNGLCYRDISFGNIFFDPQNGDILICDNDNVAVNFSAGASIAGTLGFMAPELVRGVAQPSIQTDLFSLSVLLFYMFMQNHPLEGKKEASINCLDQAAKINLYGLEPVFIFDPGDRSNEPVPGVHTGALANWPIYPLFFRNLFIKAFTTGLKDPANGRVRESEWRSCMARLRDSIFICPCEAENFYDAEEHRAEGNSKPCWSCGKETKLPHKIRIGEHMVVLNPGTRLFMHHTDDSKLYDFSSPVAEVSVHPQNPSLLGLKNLSDKKWKCINHVGKPIDVEPQKNMAIAPGTKIFFGSVEGEIYA